VTRFANRGPSLGRINGIGIASPVTARSIATRASTGMPCIWRSTTTPRCRLRPSSPMKPLPAARSSCARRWRTKLGWALASTASWRPRRGLQEGPRRGLHPSWASGTSAKKALSCTRLICFLNVITPCSSTPCTWKTFLAGSRTTRTVVKTMCGPL